MKAQTAFNKVKQGQRKPVKMADFNIQAPPAQPVMTNMHNHEGGPDDWFYGNHGDACMNVSFMNTSINHGYCQLEDPLLIDEGVQEATFDFN